MKALFVVLATCIAALGSTFQSSDRLFTFNGQISAQQGSLQNVKTTFSTNFTTTTNFNFYLLNGTNQLITLPSAASSSNTIFRFSMTNGYGSFVITNSGDGAKIRDGKSLSYTNIGINEVGFLSDGSNWWLASKGHTILVTV